MRCTNMHTHLFRRSVMVYTYEIFELITYRMHTKPICKLHDFSLRMHYSQKYAWDKHHECTLLRCAYVHMRYFNVYVIYYIVIQWSTLSCGRIDSLNYSLYTLIRLMRNFVGLSHRQQTHVIEVGERNKTNKTAMHLTYESTIHTCFIMLFFFFSIFWTLLMTSR